MRSADSRRKAQFQILVSPNSANAAGSALKLPFGKKFIKALVISL